MPTPFYHLSVAEALLAEPDLKMGLLEQNRSAFFFGNTAPDVQMISGQQREATHFFRLPIHSGDPPAWERFLSVYPAFRRPQQLPAAQAAFLAGYLCHLLADWFWIREIFAPIFGPLRLWSNFHHRLYLHNVLRAYLDQRILPQLNHNVAGDLDRAEPEDWLPFVQDEHLRQWRDYLARQLDPGADVQTVEVFAARQGIPPESYYHLLSSEEEMEQQVFTRLPRQKLDAYYDQILNQSQRLIQNYLS